ncbi:TAXI family TRAP transporter solute-binding subunit [Caldinitratiruptor microaerophilus]|uniref:C4-dicarboxylate ABC transporter substrate-binding protein n=1 Tax=Caldinitratiruptor microaerophilus TaxID=671077 RepID=A0AA35GAS8_9FIRM|nr:TAXI family TRAP transporter solute-binding subunit [Caldinitratiruptor microaerophilus]BDG61624.1 C4-dicarboxylate ABC transporter substrate-binding protein [Caldinitratiruptor microaerophilus]
MRKRSGVLLLAALLSASLLAGCGGSQSTGGTGGAGGSSQAQSSKPAQKTELIFATGGTGGTYYPLGGGMAKVWADNIPGLNVTVQSTGASVANIRALGKKEADLALIQNDTADYGRSGKEAFAEKNEKYTNYLAVAALYPEVVQIVVPADSPVKTIEDLRGKRVVVGAAGSGTELNARQIFGTYGLDYKDRKDLEPLYLSFAEGAAAMKDKQADALVIVSGVPTASLADLETATNIRLLPVDAEKVKQVYPFFVKYTVKAGTYKGMTQDTDVVALKATLVVRDELPEDLVYQMTKVLFEKAGDIGHAKAKEFDVKQAADGVTIPFHPGAAKYLKEKGVDVK